MNMQYWLMHNREGTSCELSSHFVFTDISWVRVFRLCVCRAKLFGVLIREESAFHDVTEGGQLTSRLTSDCYAFSRCVSTNVNVALRNGLQVVGKCHEETLAM